MIYKNKKGGSIWIAISIVVAGLIIAAAVMFGNNSGPAGGDPDGGGVPLEEGGDLSKVHAPEESDHMKGDLNAEIFIIEYSDTECPFCKRLHNTLDDIVEEYEGKVTWIYRHLPLTQLHTQAIVEAHATECAAELGGNDGFWTYIDRLYEITPSNNGLDLEELPNIAEFSGLDLGAFNACMEEERHLSLVEEDFREGVQAAGPRLGTPFNIIIGPDGERVAVSGALPKENWNTIIDGLLAETEE